jgi:hypothetical protein
MSIVFERDLRGNAQYDTFEQLNERPLVRLDKYKITAREAGIPGWDYNGLKQPISPALDAVVKQPGFCSTPGCVQPHDTYCDPCGHAVCCWDCLHTQQACPVCSVPITGRFLCYPDNSSEEHYRQQDYGPLAGSPDGTNVPSGMAHATQYALTEIELAQARARNKRTQQCMLECGSTLESGDRHHCRCCGKKICTACCGQRKKLLLKDPPEGTPGTEQRMIQRKFLDQWRLNWSTPKPVATVVEELNGLSDTDKARPIQLCVAGQKERTFPSQGYALQWLEPGSEDHSWERVCDACKPEILGMEMAY